MTSHTSLIHVLVGLALGVAALHPNDVRAALVPVTTCADSGPGSLRNAVAIAADGDIVDLSNLTCSPFPIIDLTSGAIVVTQNNLEIRGPIGGIGGDVRIHAQIASRVIQHTGSGLLRVVSVSIGSGQHVAEFATGGCIHSEGDVELVRIVVSSCEAVGQGGPNPMALGGAVHARNVTLIDSGIFGSLASGGNGYGGGISSEGRTTLLRSRVVGNRARSGGGVFTLGGATLTYSIISNNDATDDAGVLASGGSVTVSKSMIGFNRAFHRCGGLCVRGEGRTRVLDSTLSGNRAIYLSAGELSDDATVSNSTITSNYDWSISECVGVIRARHLKLLSTIVAANLCPRGPLAYDVGGRAWEGYTLTGSHNLIGRSRLRVPQGTISGDPQLQPLAQHGTPQLVHMPLPGSPVIDRGSNPFDRQYDERGPGFPRVKGPSTDIGSIEY
jgi:hypothetical protein